MMIRAGARVLVLALLPLLAAGCATLSESQCVAGDWYEIGKRDGAAGLQRARLFEHAEACMKYGMQPDARAYDVGRSDGLVRYCTPYQGFIEGSEGRRYRGVCPLAVEPHFLAAWRDGKALHDAREALADVDRKIHALEGKLGDEDTSDEQRKRLRRELRELDRTRRHRERDLRELEYRYQRSVVPAGRDGRR